MADRRITSVESIFVHDSLDAQAIFETKTQFVSARACFACAHQNNETTCHHQQEKGKCKADKAQVTALSPFHTRL